MKLTLYILLPFFVFLSACNHAERAEKPNPASRTRTALRSFSDTAKLDTFKIVLTGDKPKNMMFLFTITPAGSAPIYTTSLKATTLMDNYKEDLDLGREKKQLKFIEEELGLFFEDENFIEPAVTADEQPDKNTPDKKFFDELKKTGVNGFKYRLGKESKVYIAWSIAHQKVEPYYTCCR